MGSSFSIHLRADTRAVTYRDKTGLLPVTHPAASPDDHLGVDLKSALVPTLWDMAPDPTVVVVGRSPAKMRAATTVLEKRGFTVVGVFTEADALQAMAGSDDLLAVVAGGSVSAAARDRLRAAAASRCAVIVDAAIGHADPAAHFTSEVLPRLVAARTARAAHGSGDVDCSPH
jgi:rhodanese-related sulfurtransferase